MRVRLRLAVRGLVLLTVIAVPVLADAPPGQYDKFIGQDRRIKDLKTGLIWERGVSASPVKYEDAKTMCTAPRRLPTLKELLTLVDEEPHRDYDLTKLENVNKMIDFQAFGAETPVDSGYWTASSAGAGEAWAVDFGTGETDEVSVNDLRYVRCVEATP